VGTGVGHFTVHAVQLLVLKQQTRKETQTNKSTRSQWVVRNEGMGKCLPLTPALGIFLLDCWMIGLHSRSSKSD
jgi:hypothetical protein